MTTPSPPPLPSAAELSQLDCAGFVAHLAGTYEHSPWIAERAWALRPFADRAALAAALAQVLARASREEQLALIRAHPELTGKAALRTDLTADSSREQLGAGLDKCNPEEFEALHTLNARYRERFGFPFVIAVTGLDRSRIIASLRARVEQSPEEEFRTALQQIERIAGFRLEKLGRLIGVPWPHWSRSARLSCIEDTIDSRNQRHSSE